MAASRFLIWSAVALAVFATVHDLTVALANPSRQVMTTARLDPFCNCQITCSDHWVNIKCQDIVSTEAVKCIKQYLRDITNSDPSLQVDVELQRCDLKLFPDDFFKSHLVVTLEFSECGITKIPQRLINHICDTLEKLSLKYNKIKTIGEGEFNKCPALKHLDLYFNEIEEMSRMAFYGLNNLERLQLDYNRLTSFNGLVGTPQLRYLDLSENKIETIPKNAFHYLGNLLKIDLHNNALKNLENGTFDSLRRSTGFEVDLNGNPVNLNNTKIQTRGSGPTTRVCTFFGIFLNAIIIFINNHTP